MNIQSAGLLLLAAGAVDAATFSYDGHLDDRGRPANGVYDVQLTPYPTEKSGASLATPILFERVQVSDGRFRLEFELPPLQSDQAWVEVGVRDPGAGVFSRIPARTRALAAPLIGQCWGNDRRQRQHTATNFLGADAPAAGHTFGKPASDTAGGVGATWAGGRL